ncbi:hypothetical protein [Streptomyces albipurpureus]|uniref:Uncharacterized protein n=1 Tax=Streptomyces albipurpureus TaxID=2897419 RepID=A0ABT0V132_9ACTN|nr:hypothetical protein [Streptomyces sp. CWNU-1]MCM2393894.1 hypothetical protein [Streptomyces sp. CWNU-1]
MSGHTPRVYYEGRTIGRTFDGSVHTKHAEVDDDGYIIDCDEDTDPQLDLSALMENVDLLLYWHGSGRLSLLFRTTLPSVDALRPYLVGDDFHGVSVQVRRDDAVVTLARYEEDGELTYWLDEPEEWLDLLLPLHADLSAGDLSILYLGWRMATSHLYELQSERKNAPPIPPRITATEEHGWPEYDPPLAALDRILRPHDSPTPEGWPMLDKPPKTGKRKGKGKDRRH